MDKLKQALRLSASDMKSLEVLKMAVQPAASKQPILQKTLTCIQPSVSFLHAPLML